jgi:C4-dicarboxylate-specific signal transduction histidine kinase
VRTQGEPPPDRRAELFLGTLAASVTHELNNVFSTIDQAAGMLGDVAARGASGRAIDPGKLERVGELIDRQVKRGVEIVTRFNRFAHSADEPAAEFEAAEVLDNLLSLAGRFADLAKVRLERAKWQDLRGVGDAFRLQETVFSSLREMLRVSKAGERIEIRLEREGESGVVTVTGTGRPEGVKIRFRAAGTGGAGAGKERGGPVGISASDRPQEE